MRHHREVTLENTVDFGADPASARVVLDQLEFFPQHLERPLRAIHREKVNRRESTIALRNEQFSHRRRNDSDARLRSPNELQVALDTSARFINHRVQNSVIDMFNMRCDFIGTHNRYSSAFNFRSAL